MCWTAKFGNLRRILLVKEYLTTGTLQKKPDNAIQGELDRPYLTLNRICMIRNKNEPLGLYRPEFEHDSCGIGFVANLKGVKSHEIVENALSMLCNMEHRGGTGYDIASGDGAGILIQIPHDFLAEDCAIRGIELPAAGEYGVGMVFFPAEKECRKACRALLSDHIHELGLSLIGYRHVPKDNSMIGQAALDTEPQIE